MTTTSIAPWLTVRDSKAVDFYKLAFGATEAYRLEMPDGGLVVRLSVHGAEFWLSSEPAEEGSPKPGSLGGGSVRMILTVAERALHAVTYAGNEGRGQGATDG